MEYGSEDTVISQLSSHPFKFASQLSLQKFLKNQDSTFTKIYWYLQQIREVIKMFTI